MTFTPLSYIDTHLNPIMVKEVYQGFRSRSFLTALFLALLIPLGAYMVIVLGVNADTSDDDLGEALFAFISFSMIIASVFIIPSATGRQLRNDITSSALDLITITQLTPWKIISGHFQAATLHLLLLFGYAGPFAIAAFLLGGIGALSIMLFLCLLFFYSLVICSVMLMLNALPALHPANTRIAQAARVLLLLFVLLSLAIYSVVDSVQIISGGAYDPNVGWQLLNILLLLTLGALFCLRVAADMLISSSIRSFFYSKLFLMVWLAAVVGSLVVIELAGIRFPDPDFLKFVSALALFVLYIFATFWSGFYQQSLTPLRRNPFYWLLGDGYWLTFIYVGVCSLGLGALLLTLELQKFVIVSLALFCAFAFYTGIARLLVAYLLPTAKHNAFYYYAMLVSVVVLQGMVGILFIGEVDIHTSMPSLLIITTPIIWFKEWSVLDNVTPYIWLGLFIGVFAAVLSTFRQQKRSVK